MRPKATGLSLVLGRTLLAWCDQLADGGLERYQALGGLQGLQRAEALTPVEVIAELRSAGLRDRSGDAEPVYLNWQRFLRHEGTGALVVDASELDPRHLAGAELMGKNPYGLLEALHVASRATGATRCLVLLPPQLAGQAASLLNAAEQTKASGLTNGLNLEISVDRQPSIMAHPQSPAGADPVLMHDLETWYHITLVMALGADWHEALGVGGHTGTRLLTLLGAVNQPGLVETPMGSELWQVVLALGEGVKPGTIPLALAVDGGMGGYLPPPAAQIALGTEELMAVRVNPGLGSLELLSEGQCLVDLTRRILYRYWVLVASRPGPERNLITRALRMVTEITQGKGLVHHVDELLKVGRAMAAARINAAWPLVTSLTYFRNQWDRHGVGRECPQGICLERPLAPCHRTCPAGIDIPSFLALDGHGRYDEAVASISKDNPLPYVCGLVCPAPCEGACLRGDVDQPLSIRAMKAVAAHHVLNDHGVYPTPKPAPATGKRVAVVGAGPGGLTAAYYLALKGHEVTILDAQEEAGGMLRYGIPAYRLPHEVLEAEVKRITDLGVEMITGQSVENIAQLRVEGYDAIFLAVGTQVSRLIPIEGVDHLFVLGGLDFLKDVRGGQNVRVGPRVVVVGGGNVSIDVALTAIRQGAKRVDMVCLEKRREMPASVDEINQALDEGVAIHNSWGPLKIDPEGSITFQRCTRVFDERGRFSPEFDLERTMTLEADHVILAIGQATDLACVEAGSEVEVQRGLICADPVTLATREEGVFAGGDVVSGPRTVVEAVGAGKRAAASIDAYLKGEPLDSGAMVPVRRAEVEPLKVSAMDRTNLKRPEMPMREVADRQGNYHQIELGLTDEMAHIAASRCLRCDLCIGCGLCQLVCSEIEAEALRLSETKADRLAFKQFTRPSTRCVGCGACGCVCPTGAIKVVDTEDGRRQIILTGTVVKEHQLMTCSDCGQKYAPLAYLDHLKRRVGPAAVPHVELGICPPCARKRRAWELAGTPFFNFASA